MSMLSQWIQSLTIYKTMLKYYQDKNVVGRILFFVFIVALFVFLVWGTRSLSFDRLNTGDITFAEEVIPVDGVYFYNQEKYDRELALTKMDPAQIVMIHKREPWYIPTIRRALDKASIPEDFVYLPIAESALRNVAVSTA